MVKSPLNWVGGKYRLAKKLIPMFPAHVTYVEPFGGAAHVLIQKPPSKLEVYNDIDGRLINFFRVVADDEKCKELCRRLRLTLYSRKEWEDAKANITVGSDIDMAYSFAVLNKQSFGGKMGTWGIDISTSKQSSAFSNMLDVIIKAHERIKRVQIEYKPFEYILQRYDRPETFFYIDPPYPYTGERGKDKLYVYEMSDADHVRLADMLLKLQGKAMLSGYNTVLYEPLEQAGWRKVDVGKSAICIQKRAGRQRSRKEEFVWCNY